jgi:hypothetical protein
MLRFASKMHALKEKEARRVSGGNIRRQEFVRYQGNFVGLETGEYPTLSGDIPVYFPLGFAAPLGLSGSGAFPGVFLS